MSDTHTKESTVPFLKELSPEQAAEWLIHWTKDVYFFKNEKPAEEREFLEGVQGMISEILCQYEP